MLCVVLVEEVVVAVWCWNGMGQVEGGRWKMEG